MGVSNVVALAMCNAIVDEIDVGGGTAQLKIYGGTRPTDVDTPVGAQTLISTHNLPNPAFGNAADINPGARATANGMPNNATAAAGATATWFRIFNRAGTPVIDGNVGTTASDLILNSVNISVNQTVSITSGEVIVREVSP